MQVKWYHIIVIVACLLLGWHLGSKNPKVVVETIYDTSVDTLYIDSIIYDTDTLVLPPRPIDTNAVVNDYYHKRTIDTTITVNEVKIKFTGSLYENNIRDVQFAVQNLKPTQVVKEMKWSIWGGASLGNQVFAPSVDLQYANHKLGVGYNLIGDNQLIFSYKYKIWES